MRTKLTFEEFCQRAGQAVPLQLLAIAEKE